MLSSDPKRNFMDGFNLLKLKIETYLIKMYHLRQNILWYMASFLNSRATHVHPPTATLKIKRKRKKTSFTTVLNFLNEKIA
jgi:hypothetical protein